MPKLCTDDRTAQRKAKCYDCTLIKKRGLRYLLCVSVCVVCALGHAILKCFCYIYLTQRIWTNAKTKEFGWRSRLPAILGAMTNASNK